MVASFKGLVAGGMASLFVFAASPPSSSAVLSAALLFLSLSALPLHPVKLNLRTELRYAIPSNLQHQL